MIKIIPTKYTHQFQVEIYAWSNEEQKNILVGHHEIYCHIDGTLSTKNLLGVKEE